MAKKPSKIKPEKIKKLPRTRTKKITVKVKVPIPHMKPEVEKEKSPFNKKWILETGVPIVESYNGNLTLRSLHYRLVAAGMTNDIAHYKKVVNTMIDARWSGEVHYESFLDHERETHGTTDYEETTVDDQVSLAKAQIKLWANNYKKNRWENQPYYPEVFIEKKALQGVFVAPCRNWNVALNPCKGYPSLTFQWDACKRFQEAIEAGKKPIILYFGDYDPSGEDIPRSIYDTLLRMGADVEVRRVALMEHQVVEWKLPPAPTKVTDTRSGAWEGLGQVELDAVLPEQITELLEDALKDIFDDELYDELQDIRREEDKAFKKILKRDFKTLLD